MFTPCGDLLPGLDAHDRLREYGAKFHTCEQSTVTLTNHAIGATSCLFAEKCIAQRVRCEAGRVGSEAGSLRSAE